MNSKEEAMTDREKVLEVIREWDIIYWGGEINLYSPIDKLADRLIEAGFGRVNRPHDKYAGKPEHEQRGWQPE